MAACPHMPCPNKINNWREPHSVCTTEQHNANTQKASSLTKPDPGSATNYFACGHVHCACLLTQACMPGMPPHNAKEVLLLQTSTGD